MKVAALYLQKLYAHASDPLTCHDNQPFKMAHAEGACAVFRDLGMLTSVEDGEWRKKFRENCMRQLDRAAQEKARTV